MQLVKSMLLKNISITPIYDSHSTSPAETLTYTLLLKISTTIFIPTVHKFSQWLAVIVPYSLQYVCVNF